MLTNIIEKIVCGVGEEGGIREIFVLFTPVNLKLL